MEEESDDQSWESRTRQETCKKKIKEKKMKPRERRKQIKSNIHAKRIRKAGNDGLW